MSEQGFPVELQRNQVRMLEPRTPIAVHKGQNFQILELELERKHFDF
jgi:hypothetical protein